MREYVLRKKRGSGLQLLCGHAGSLGEERCRLVYVDAPAKGTVESQRCGR